MHAAGRGRATTLALLVLKTTGSAISTAFAYALEFIPYIGLGLIAGVFTDRADRRRVMVRCDALSALLAVEIAILASFSDPSLALLYLSVFALACVRPFYFPAFQGLLVDKYSGPRLVRLNSWTQGVDSILTMLGPVAGAAVVVAVGATAASLANAATFVVSALLVAGISYSRAADATPPARGLAAIGADFVAGIRMVLSSRFVAVGAAVITIGNLAIFAVESNLFYLALRVEHLPRVAVGIVFAGQGLGSVVGAVLAPRLIERIGTRSALWMGVAVSTLAMCLPLLWPHWPVVLVAWTVQGVSTSFVVVSYFTARQELIPASAIGRAASVTRAVAYTALPVGALLGGWLVERSSSVRAVFGSAAAIEAALLLVGLAIAGVPALHSGAASCSAGCGARPTPPATRRPSLRPSGAERQDRDWLVVLPIRADPWWLLLAVAIVGPLATRLFYLAATENYVAFGELVRSSIDLYRFDLLDALRVTRPHSLRDERVLWDALQRVSAAGQEGIDLSYHQDPAPERQP